MCMLLVFSMIFTPFFVSAKHNFKRSSEGLSIEQIQLQELELSIVEEALDQAECGNGQCEIQMVGSLGMLAYRLISLRYAVLETYSIDNTNRPCCIKISAHLYYITAISLGFF